jgi:hypothetical protein
VAEAPPPPTEIQWAWQRLERSGGEASIGELSEELGWSRRRLGAGFRDQVGVPPKTLAGGEVARRDRDQRLTRPRA